MANKLIDQLTADPDFLELSEEDQDAMYEELSGRQQTQAVSSSGIFDSGAAERNRQQIEARKSPVEQYGPTLARRSLEAVRDPLGAIRKRTAPITGTLEMAKDAFPAIGAAGQTAEAIAAEAGLGLQQESSLAPIGNRIVRALRGESAAQIGDIPRASGIKYLSSEPAATAIGLAATTLPFNKPIGQGVKVAKESASAGYKTLRTLLTGGRNIKADELVTLSEEAVAKLPELERSTYRQLKNLEVSKQLESQGAALRKQFGEVMQAIKQEKAQLGKSAPSVAAKRLEQLNEPFRKLQHDQSTLHTEMLDKAFDSTPSYDVPLNREELNKAVADKFLTPGADEDPILYRRMMDILDNELFVNRDEISARAVHNAAKNLTPGRAALNKSRAFTPDEVVGSKLRDVLMERLRAHDVDLGSANKTWADWVPVRDLGLKLQTPSGPGQLIRIVKGKDPVRAKHLESLEVLLGEKLDKETKGVFDQLDTLKQQEIIEQAKLAERNRLLSQRYDLAKKSAAESKLNIEQMARHRDLIRKLVFYAASGAAAGLGLRGALQLGRATEAGGTLLTGE